MFESDAGLRIGTSSWSERDWLGVFYPKKTPQKEFIRHYATAFDTVELDASFYHIPAESHVLGWKQRTPDNFLFAAKTPRLITHEKQLQQADGDMFVFLETMRILASRCGPILLQFPYFNRGAFASSKPFFKRLRAFLDKLPRDFRYAVEIRNPKWVGPELQEICAEHQVAVAWTEQSWMPQAESWLDQLGGPSTDFVYIRWLGDHQAIEEITDKWHSTVVDRKPELEAWATVVQELRAQKVDVFGYFNNHFAGHAPASIELFRTLMGGEARDHRPPNSPPSPFRQQELF